jgi:hypothetical protein
MCLWRSSTAGHWREDVLGPLVDLFAREAWSWSGADRSRSRRGSLGRKGRRLVSRFRPFGRFSELLLPGRRQLKFAIAEAQPTP